MSSSNEQVPDPEVPAKARTRRHSASYKAEILAEYEELDKAGKGALLRAMLETCGPSWEGRTFPLIE